MRLLVALVVECKCGYSIHRVNTAPGVRETLWREFCLFSSLETQHHDRT